MSSQKSSNHDSQLTTHDYSTTKLLYKLLDDSYLDETGKIKEDQKWNINNSSFKIQNSKLLGKPEDKFETVLFLPEGEGRKGEGGLRTKGYFKFSYMFVNSELENGNGELEIDNGESESGKVIVDSKSNSDQFTIHESRLTTHGQWYITDSDDNPITSAPIEIQQKINEYLNSSTHQPINSFTHLPLISIITVVYNGEKYLEETIQSVINQTYPNVEYIIVDGGSTDGTLDIIKKYEDRIDYWLSERDKGIYDAMNKGWSLISANSNILFLGAGDKIISLPSQELLSNYFDFIIYGKVKLENSTFNSLHGWRLNLGNTLHHQALLVPKILHLSPPFNIRYPTYADYDFNLRLYKAGNNFIYSDSFVGYAMPNGVSAQLKILEMAKISMRNSGLFWGVLSLMYCCYQYIKIKSNNFVNR